MNSGRNPITKGRIDPLAGDAGPDADAVIGRVRAMSVSGAKHLHVKRRCNPGGINFGCEALEATSFIALSRVDVQLVVGVYDGARH